MIEFDEKKHQYKVDGVIYPSVTEILEPLTAPGYSKINPAILEEAKERGTFVHEVTQDIDLGMPPEEVADYDAGYVTAYLTFLDDYGPEWENIEYPFYAQILDYCGTIDRVGYIGGERCVVDLKTSSSPTTDQKIAVCCQTMAYAMGIERPSARRYALYLHSDGSYELFDCEQYEEDKGFSSRALFGQLLELHDTLKKIKSKRAKKHKEAWE